MIENPNTLRVRFAPSPTGFLHLGSARTALFNWLFARHHGGTFILRIEDTDLDRSRPEVTEQVLAALRWLGLPWDEGPGVGGAAGPYFQTERRALHHAHVQRLLDEGKAYPCYMLPEELEGRRAAAQAEGRAFRHEGWHRELTRAEVAAFEAAGRRPAVRLRVEAGEQPYTVDDLIKGPTTFPADSVDDFILLRSDGSPSFHLANVVDDATMGITHVIRGEDHLPNTPRHLLLFKAFGYEPPRYAHLPMILGADRSKLSKRHGAVSVMDYAAEGYLPEAMVNMLALLGWSPEDGKEELSAEELVRRFDLDRCGRSGAIFDLDKLRHLNGVRIRALTPQALAAAVAPYGEAVADVLSAEKIAAAARLVQKELVVLGDFAPLVRAVMAEPDYGAHLREESAMREAPKVVAALADAFAAYEGPWEAEPLKALVKRVGKDLGLKGKELFFPLRGALTGCFHGPDMDGILTLLGREAVQRRLARLIEWWESSR